jgi:competence protein ComEA
MVAVHSLENPMFQHKSSAWALLLGFGILLFAGSILAGPVNINTADAATLSRELQGIGLKRAQAIIEYRQKHGPFKSVDELALVKGIGPAAIAKNRELIRIEVKPVTKAVPAGGASQSSRRQ